MTVPQGVAAGDAANRTIRGSAQNATAGAIVTLVVYFGFERGGETLPALVTAAMIVVVAAVLTMAQNLVENVSGRAWLKRVPEEPVAAAGEP